MLVPSPPGYIDFQREQASHERNAEMLLNQICTPDSVKNEIVVDYRILPCTNYIFDFPMWYYMENGRLALRFTSHDGYGTDDQLLSFVGLGVFLYTNKGIRIKKHTNVISEEIDKYISKCSHTYKEVFDFILSIGPSRSGGLYYERVKVGTMEDDDFVYKFGTNWPSWLPKTQ